MEFLSTTGSSYMIFYHIRPDGDCIGTAFALAVFLQANGNKTLVLGEDSVPDRFRYYLGGYTDDLTYDTVPEDVIRVSVDTSTPNRLGIYENEKIDICIDHHMNNKFTAPVKIIEEDAGSCTEIMFSLLKGFLHGHPKCRQICNLLFMGLITDTNCFRNEGTRPESFRTASELAKLGAEYYEVAQRYALIKSSEQLEFERRLTQTYQKVEKYGIVSGILTQQDAKEIGMSVNAFESLSSLPMEMEDTRISLVIRELQNGDSRVAVRSRGKISAEAICKKYGGGGHHNAAGCTLGVPVEEMRELFVKAAVDYLENEYEDQGE